MRALLPVLLLLAACDRGTDAPAPPPQAITVANPYHDALLAAEELPRFATIRAAIDRGGQPCRTVQGAAPQGDWRNFKQWTVRCATGNARGGSYLYALFLAPDGTTQVRSCQSLAAVNAQAPELRIPACRADLLNAPATSTSPGN